MKRLVLIPLICLAGYNLPAQSLYPGVAIISLEYKYHKCGTRQFLKDSTIYPPFYNTFFLVANKLDLSDSFSISKFTKPNKEPDYRLKNGGITIKVPEAYNVYNSDTIRIKFYTSPNDTASHRQIDFYQVKGKEYILCNFDTADFFDKSVNISPYWEPPFRYFICKRKKGRWLEIVIEKGGKTLWVRRDQYINFSSWSKIMDDISIENYGVIYSARDTSSKPIDCQYKDGVEINKVSGEWMRICRSVEGYPKCGDTNTVNIGWIKFKSKGKFLIRLFVN